MRRVVEYKTKSLSVNPFRSWGFPWLGKKARPEGPREEGGAYYPPNTAQSLSRRAFAAEKSGSYTNNNYSLSAESQQADY